MSIGRLVIDLVANTGSFETDIGRAAKAAERRSKEIDRSISRLGAGIKAGFAGFVAGFSLNKIIEASSEAETALAALDNAVKNNGGAAGQTTRELTELSTELQRMTNYTDEAVQGAQSLLLGFRQIGGDEFKRAEVVILDVATALGKDLNSSALLVGRALADPVKGMSALSKAGVVLSESQKDLIKSLAETGQLSKAQGILLSQLEGRYAGAAKAARDTLGGAVQGLKIAFDDLFEVDPGKTSALTGAINDLTKLVSDPEIKAGISNLAAGLLTIVTLAAKAAAGVGNVFGTVATYVRGGDTEIDRTITKLETLRVQLQQIERGSNQGDKDALAKRIAAAGTELDRQVGRGGSTTRRRPTPATTATSEAAEPSEEFTKLKAKLEEQIALHGKVGEAAKLSYELQIGALEGVSKAEGELLLSEARRLDAMNAKTEADKQAAAAQLSAKTSIDGMIASVEQQVATFEASATETLRYRVNIGDLAGGFDLLGERGDELREKLIGLTEQMQLMQEASAGAKEAIAEFSEQNDAELEKFGEKISKQFEVGVGDEFGKQWKDGAFGALSTGIYDGITEGAKKGWKGFADAGLETINRLVAVALAKKLANALFSDTGESGSGGGFASLIGSLFGPGKAYGGSVSAGTLYPINEREPEYFKPNSNGQVIPLSRMPSRGGGGNITQNIYTQGRIDSRTANQIARATAQEQRLASARFG